MATVHGIENAEIAKEIASEVGLPYHVAMALLWMESKGKNVFGHDSGGMYPGQAVTKEKFLKLESSVLSGGRANGVGPTQVTHKSHFPAARKAGLELWRVDDNMRYGFRLLARHLAGKPGDYERAGRLYNGKQSYGVTFKRVVNEWEQSLGDEVTEELCGFVDGW